ncbi:MAG: LptF/LptG family permease, partial [Planctomycetota bacterium]
MTLVSSTQTFEISTQRDSTVTIIDRYLLVQFCKIFLICFVSLAGLYVVIHIFTNLDEVVQITGESGGLESLVFDFYGPRVLDVFNRIAGILVLVAAVFSIALMQRKREATATEAAGITKARLIRPVLIAGLIIVALVATSREIYIPQYKAMLVRSLTNWKSTGTVPMHHQKDFESGVLIKGHELVIGESKITNIELTLPQRVRSDLKDLKSQHGIVKAADPSTGIPAGILLQVNVEPEK